MVKGATERIRSRLPSQLPAEQKGEPPPTLPKILRMPPARGPEALSTDYVLLSKELAKKNADKVKSFMDVGPLCDKRVFGL